MKVLITGAGGMLAQDVARAANRRGDETVALDRAALDVTDAVAVRDALATARPDAVIQCAAWTDVDGAEAAETAARRLNEDGARNVAEGAAAVGAKLVLPSTDYVFDGRGISAAPSPHAGHAGHEPDGGARRPYLESDPTEPLSAYGRTKLAGERAALAADPRTAVARTAWLFGRGGPNFVETMLRLAAERGAVRAVDDQVGSPTFSGHLADGLLALAATDSHGVHHIAGAGHCSWHDFAAAIFEDAGVACDLEPTTTAEFPRPAPRPAWSVLASERADRVSLPPWREGLRAYLAERAPAAP